jgi:hypothetical protein
LVLRAAGRSHQPQHEDAIDASIGFDLGAIDQERSPAVVFTKRRKPTNRRLRLLWVNLDRPNHPSTVSYPIDQLPTRKLRIA